jgi:hypothetical protein
MVVVRPPVLLKVQGVERMAKVPQSSDELMRQLRDNIGFLKSSASDFDSGNTSEAKRLAATIRLLVHDGGTSKSLLGQLGLKAALRLPTTITRHNPQNLLGYCGLVGFALGSTGARYWAPLGDGPPTRYLRAPLPFDEWWNETVIVDTNHATFSRAQLIRTLADQDGGVHVDPSLDAAYAALTRDDSAGYNLTEIELHSVRQIAYELLLCLKDVQLPT